MPREWTGQRFQVWDCLCSRLKISPQEPELQVFPKEQMRNNENSFKKLWELSKIVKTATQVFLFQIVFTAICLLLTQGLAAKNYLVLPSVMTREVLPIL